MRVEHGLGNPWRRLEDLLADQGRRRRLLLAYCIAVILAYGGALGLVIRGGILPWARGDFIAYYTGARLLREGYGPRLYDLTLQEEIQQDILRPYGFIFAEGVLPYNYPPLLAILLVPLSFFSLRSAFLVWVTVSLGLILASAALLERGGGGRSKEGFMVTTLLALAFFPVMEGLVKGQSIFVVLFALSMTYWALKRDQCLLAGVALSLGLVKPHLMLLMVIYLLYRRRWRAMLSFGVTGAGTLAISTALIGVQGVQAYSALLRQESGWVDALHVHPGRMANVRGIVYRGGLLAERWLNVDLSSAAMTAAMGFITICVLAIVFRSWGSFEGSSREELDLSFALTVVSGLLISPHLNGHDLSLLVLVGGVVWRHAQASGRGAGAWRLTAVGHLAPLVLPAALPSALDTQVLALVLLLFVIVLWRWSAQDGARSNGE